MFKIIKTIYNCNQCPKLQTGKTFGNDGRDGVITHKCAYNIWGEYENPFYLKYSQIPEKIPEGCPLNTSNTINYEEI